MNEVHICPVLLRTVVWIDGKWTEQCKELSDSVGSKHWGN